MEKTVYNINYDLKLSDDTWENYKCNILSFSEGSCFNFLCNKFGRNRIRINQISNLCHLHGIDFDIISNICVQSIGLLEKLRQDKIRDMEETEIDLKSRIKRSMDGEKQRILDHKETLNSPFDLKDY